MTAPPLAVVRTVPPGAARSTEKAPARRRRRGNGQTQLTRDELERMLFDAAQARAANARSHSRA